MLILLIKSIATHSNEVIKIYCTLNNELYHHGIKGQKWGVRRFQNPDGSLTSAGQKRKARREKEADSLDNIALDAKNRAEKHTKNIEDLKRNGTRSAKFKEVYGDVSKLSDKEFSKSSYHRSKQSAVNDLIQAEQINRKSANKTAESYTKKANDLRSAKIESDTVVERRRRGSIAGKAAFGAIMGVAASGVMMGLQNQTLSGKAAVGIMLGATATAATVGTAIVLSYLNESR